MILGSLVVQFWGPKTSRKNNMGHIHPKQNAPEKNDVTWRFLGLWPDGNDSSESAEAEVHRAVHGWKQKVPGYVDGLNSPRAHTLNFGVSQRKNTVLQTNNPLDFCLLGSARKTWCEKKLVWWNWLPLAYSFMVLETLLEGRGRGVMT